MPPIRNILPVDRWSVLVLTGCTVLLAGVLWLDYLTVWVLLLFYLIPVIVAASVIRGYWWVVVSIATTVLWYMVRYAAPGPDALDINDHFEAWPTGLWNSIVRLGVLLLVGFLCARLRHYSRSPDSLSSSHDATGLLSAVGLRETLSRSHTVERLAQGPVAMLLLDVERRVSAYAGQSNEYAALVGAIIGKLVLEHARAADLCVRLSPNHFLVIMPETGQAAATEFYSVIQNSLPEIARSLDDSVAISTLLLYSSSPGSNVNKMRVYAENRLITLKVLGQGRNHAEAWPPAAPEPQGQPVTAA